MLDKLNGMWYNKYVIKREKKRGKRNGQRIIRKTNN